MPHIIAEHSHELDHLAPCILSALHESLSAEESVDIARLKTRAISLHDYVVGAEGKKEMVHVTLKVMPRPADVKKRMAENLQKAVMKLATGAAVTVEVVELDPDSYCS
ncbi:MAG: 5-carboxymethyl-2-hydroxymuconate Delta-isomerase [Alphaproteobacteria bacterium]